MVRETGKGGFQAKVVAELEEMFEGCLVLKGNSSFRQGIPDILVLYKDRWAMLEVKASKNANRQPNQEYYVDELDEMSFAAFIYPENKEQVLYDLQQSFET